MENLNNNRNSTISSIFWKFNERMSSQLISFVISVVLARLLMPEAYGLLALISVFITIGDKLVISGFSTSLIQKKDADDLDFSTVFYFSLFSAIILYLSIYFIAPFIANFFYNYDFNLLVSVIRVMGLKLLLTAINSVQLAFVSKNMLFKKYFFSTLIGTIISGIIGIWMAYNNFNVWALVGQYISNSLINTIIIWLTVKWRPNNQFSITRLNLLFGFGLKIFISSIIRTLFNDLRSLVIGKYFSSIELAYYNKGLSFPQLIDANIVGTIDSVMFPAFARNQNSRSNIKLMLRNYIKTSSYIVMPLLFGLAAVSDKLVLMVLTEKWLPSSIYLQILSFSFVLSPIEIGNLQAIKAIGEGGVILRLEVIKKIMGVAFIIISIPFGPLVIALSMILYSITSTLINAYPNRIFFDYSFKEQVQDVINPFLLSLLMFVIVMFLHNLDFGSIWVLLIQIIVGIIVYITASIIFKVDSYKYLLKADCKMKSSTPRN